MSKGEQLVRIAIILLLMGWLVWNTYKQGDVFPGSAAWLKNNYLPLIGLTIGVGVFLWRAK